MSIFSATSGTKSRIEATKETVLATRDALLDIEQQVLLRAVAAYMGVIESSEFVALRQNNVRLLTQELRAARDRFEVGEVTRTDVSLAEARCAVCFVKACSIGCEHLDSSVVRFPVERES